MTELVRIESDGILYAQIIRHSYRADGVDFVTEPKDSQQVAYMSHKKGYIIDAHYHNTKKRVIYKTQEVLIVKRGKLRCDIYDNKQVLIDSTLLEEGDLIILLDGGHGFAAIEDIELIEIKQGPFLGAEDKTRFTQHSTIE